MTLVLLVYLAIERVIAGLHVHFEFPESAGDMAATGCLDKIRKVHKFVLLVFVKNEEKPRN